MTSKPGDPGLLMIEHHADALEDVYSDGRRLTHSSTWYSYGREGIVGYIELIPVHRRKASRCTVFRAQHQCRVEPVVGVSERL